MKMVQEPLKLKNQCFDYTKNRGKNITRQFNDFAIKMIQERSKLKNDCFYYTKDREQT